MANPLYLEKNHEQWLKSKNRTCIESNTSSRINKTFSIRYGKPNKPIRIGSLFSGIGGFEQSLKFLRLKFDLVFACDSDKFVKQSFFANHSEHITDDKWHLDIEDFNKKEAKKYKGKVDLLVGGPPCQSFSVIGRHGGLNDARGNLVYEYIKAIEKINPKVFIFENVRGLMMIQKGLVWKKLLSDFQNIGYKITWRVLNARDFGIPQNRDRIYIIGFKNKNVQYSWPKPWALGITMRKLLEKHTYKKYLLPKKGVKFVTNQYQLSKKYTQVNGINALCQKANQQSNWHGDFLEVNYDQYLDRYTLSDKVQDFVTASGSKKFNAKPDIDRKVAHTLLSSCHKMHRAGVDNYISRKNKNIRRLTPRECLNLMGWVNKSYKPMKFETKYNNVGISDTQLYRQAGNSVVVWVAAQIISNLPFNNLKI